MNLRPPGPEPGALARLSHAPRQNEIILAWLGLGDFGSDRFRQSICQFQQLAESPSTNENRIGRAVLAVRGSESLNFKGLLIGDRPIRATVCSAVYSLHVSHSFVTYLINALFENMRSSLDEGRDRLRTEATFSLKRPAFFEQMPFAR